MSETLLASYRPDYGMLPCGWLAVDINTFTMGKRGAAKEDAGRICAGIGGFCPMASFIGANGWPLELSLCPGVQHSAKDTEDDLHRVIPMARRVSAAGPKAPLPVRLDSGFDWAALMVLRSNIPIGALLQMPERTPRMTSSKFRA